MTHSGCVFCQAQTEPPLTEHTSSKVGWGNSGSRPLLKKYSPFARGFNERLASERLRPRSADDVEQKLLVL